MWDLIWPVLLIVAANTFYQIAAKSTPQSVNAFASLSITYIVGAVLAVAMFFLTGGRRFFDALGQTNWTAWALGAAIVGLEFGSICLYRAGWKLGVGQLVSSALLTCVLLLVGFLLYHQSVSAKQLVGAAVCLAGVWLISV